jgi:small subunit ribosomal protein S8
MMTDPIADMLTRIRNASIVNKSEVAMPFSKIKERIAATLVTENYLDSFEIKEPGKSLVLKLKYDNKKPAITHIKRISKPGCRVYVSRDKISEVLNGYGLAILSTSSGIMTNKEAKAKKIGGELLCEIW